MLKVLKSGFFSTIQDNGRLGFLNKGVPISGYMDSFSALKANMLLSNQADASVIEVTMTGPTLQFEKPTYICIGGAEISVTLNNKPMRHFKVYKIEEGDILSYGRLKKGFRSYLAIKAGFKSQRILGSRSYYLPITSESHLVDGVTLDYEATAEFIPKTSEIIINGFLDKTVLTVSKGPEFELFPPEELKTLFTDTFSVAKEYNRMAYQLEQKLPNHQISILTSATHPGTVQITPTGKLIVLMKDGQTTGGYPRLLQLSDMAISILAQKKYGDDISFELI
jgi:biotin-dependent carboxylase-like uncharacterized protein